MKDDPMDLDEPVDLVETTPNTNSSSNDHSRYWGPGWDGNEVQFESIFRETLCPAKIPHLSLPPSPAINQTVERGQPKIGAVLVRSPRLTGALIILFFSWVEEKSYSLRDPVKELTSGSYSDLFICG
ncbi:unnamed protein product [Larinioides sclopetarius]|uniref:Uncharacterized protein n=1 Tax=Larinioides sclopetarius TaxID=280406 RepID=A0AAV2BX69_9ARAC